MPNICSQQIDANLMRIIASDGRSFSVTRTEIKAYFDSLSGTLPQRITQTLMWLRNSIVAALGAEQVDLAKARLAFRTSDGAPIGLDMED